jgi:alkylation response protein AidB-like acyl-CoA dehydrogenase
VDFALTPEQEALRDTARAFLTGPRAAAAGPAAAAGAVGGAGAGKPARPELDWAELGWLDPQLGTVELAVLAEQMGHACYAAPWWSTAVLAGPALTAGGRTPTAPATLAWAEPKGTATLAAALDSECAGADDGTVTGQKILVPHAGDVAEIVVVARGPAGVELRLVEAASVAASTQRFGLDPSRPVAGIDLVGAPSTPLVAAEETPGVLTLIRRKTLAVLAAEAVGVAARALAIGVEYAGMRTQFGRPIGANQAVAHPLAEAYGQVETAKSLAYRAAWSVDAEPGPAADVAVAAATVAAREAAIGACEAAMQTLGGIGFTWEHPVHHWYRRAWWLATFDGPVADFRAGLAARLLDQSSGR